ncbi:unnamed protein product, partial [Allacma fusca]
VLIIPWKIGGKWDGTDSDLNLQQP